LADRHDVETNNYSNNFGIARLRGELNFFWTSQDIIGLGAAKKMTRLKIVAVVYKSVVVKKRLQGDATFLGSRPTSITTVHPIATSAVF
jgi:hypothetical protein